MTGRIDGTQGYDTEADALVRQYESFDFAAAHQHVVHLLPRPPAAILDIGAGTGRDAAALASRGHRVVAVEPVAAFRRHAERLHGSAGIEWLDDWLPNLAVVSVRRERFPAVMLTAVWMHLDAAQRRRAMPRVVSLLEPGGVLLLTLRHGSVPPGRRMFDVTATATIALAKASGLRCILSLENGDGVLNRPGISWDRLAFRRIS